MNVAKWKLDGPAGYAAAAGLFLIALSSRLLTSGWLQSHYPYLSFFAAVFTIAYISGFGPALLASALCGLAAYFTYAPAEFAPAAQSNPLAGAGILFLTAVACALAISSLRAGRERLVAETRRYAQLAESRDLLYRELQHRVSNNIQVVAGLLRMQASTAEPAAKRALNEAAARVGLIGKIQRDLYSQSGAPTPFRDFAWDLLANAVRAAGAEGVTIQIEGGATPLHPEQVTPVSLVLLECVNNALEHAYADGRQGAVCVDLSKVGDRWRLTVRDNGPGPADGFDIGADRNFGLKIVQAMAAQLQGEFTIAREKPGALCQLTYPALD